MANDPNKARSFWEEYARKHGGLPLEPSEERVLLPSEQIATEIGGDYPSTTDSLTGSPKGILATAPAIAEAVKLIGGPSKVASEAALALPGAPKKGWQSIDEAAGLPVSSPEEEAANRELFKDSPITGDTQAAIADFIENPSFTNFFGMPVAAVGMTGKPGKLVAKKAGAGPVGQLVGEVALDPTMYAGAGITKLSKLNEVNKTMALSPEIIKLFEAAKAGNTEARAAIAADKGLKEAQAAHEAASLSNGPASGALRRRFAGVESKPTTPVGEALKNRHTPTAPQEDLVGDTLKRKFGGAQPASAVEEEANIAGDPLRKRFAPKQGPVITGNAPEPIPSPSPAASASPDPVITEPSPPPSPTPVATTAAEETASVVAKKPWWDRSVRVPLTGLDVSVNPVQNIRNNPRAAPAATAAGAGTLAYSMGKKSQLNTDSAALSDAEGRLAAADGGGRGTAPATNSPPPDTREPAVPTGVPAAADEGAIYDKEMQEIGATGIDNLNDAANTIPSAREGAVDPQIAKDREAIQHAIKGVNEAADKKEPEGNSWNENLGLVLATVGGALSGDTEAPVRISDRIKKGQKDKIGALQESAQQKLRGAQQGLDATLSSKGIALREGEQRVGDVTKIAGLRQQAIELGRLIQSEKDPYKRQQKKAQLDLINSEIAKNQSSSNFYQSGARVQNQMAEAEGKNISNVRSSAITVQMIDGLVKQGKMTPEEANFYKSKLGVTSSPSPNRSSAGR